MSNGSDIAAEIASALAEVGTDTGAGALVATVTREQPDETIRTPWSEQSEVEPLTYEINVIRDSWKWGEINGTSILADDLKLMAQAGVVIPTPADKITLAGEVYNIMDVMLEAVGGVDLYYIIQARK